MHKEHRTNTHPQTNQSKQQIFRETAPPKKEANKSTASVNHKNAGDNHCKNTQKQASLHKIISSFLPSSLYNRETKKIFGILSAEDLLLIALILLFAENEDNDDPFTTLALIYILLSDYIDLPDLLI